MSLSVEGKRVREGLSTGSLSLNYILSGTPGVGFAWGRIVEIKGAEQAGKTTLTLHVIAEAQKAGYSAAFVDAEHALDPEYAERLGVSVSEMGFSQPESGEEALEVVEACVDAGFNIVVVDSVASLVPQAELDGEMGAAHMGLQARLMSQAMRKLTGKVGRSKCVLIFINQIRHKIGLVFGDKETTPGGNALKFYASYRLDVRAPRGDKIESKDLMGSVETGTKAKVKCIKNKVYPPFKMVEYTIVYGEGLDKVEDLFQFLKISGRVVTEPVLDGKGKPEKDSKGKEKTREVVTFSFGTFTPRTLRNSLESDPELLEKIIVELRQ